MGPKPAARDKAGSAPSKQNAGPAALSARSDTFLQKRATMAAARAIPAQPADAALKDGQLDLQAFVAAHEFEIRSLEQSMATSKTVNSSRAFQQVPRGLRRRTASHNPKRVPRRLRARARREMEEDNTPLVEARRRKPGTTRARIRAETGKRLRLLAARKKRRAEKHAGSMDLDTTADDDNKKAQEERQFVTGRKPRPKIRRNTLNEPPKAQSKFRKRQINKTWLPTHTWHAKRARMTEPRNPLWRFAIPLTPNEKIYRPTHRAQGERGALVWDMSYMSTIALYGNPIGVERVLKRIGVSQESCWNDKGKKWRMGSRSWTGILSRESAGKRRNMCPCTLFWNPESSIIVAGGDSTKKKSTKQVYLRIHPSAFLEVFNELLRLTKMENPRLYIEDLRFEIGSIELTGPASTETLLAVLSPHGTKGNPTTRHGHLFQSLRGLTNAASLPANAMLGFSAQDPRLRYPPQKVEFPDDPQAELDLLETISRWPAEDELQPYTLFDRDARHRASCLPSQKALNRRKSNKPGCALKPTIADPPIPIILLATRSGSYTQTQGTWTLLAPWKCILPIWYSIVHTPLVSGFNPRFAGLDESMQVSFERGQPWFPADYVSTDASAEWELEQRRKRKWAWGRRPKSKRIEWASLNLGAGRKGEIGDGLACDFEFLFGLPVPSEDEEEPAAQEETTDAMDMDEKESQAVKKVPSPPRETPPLKLINDMSRITFSSLLKSPTPPTTWPNTILRVKISLLSRGVVKCCARVYRLPSPPTFEPTSPNAEVPASMPPPTAIPSLPNDLRSQWLNRQPSILASITRRPRAYKPSKSNDMETRKRQLALELIAKPEPYPAAPANHGDIGGHPLVPNADDLVGFVTTGSFSLADGHGVAIGSLAVDKVLGGVRQDIKEGKLCIVRNAGENVGWLARWEVL